MRIVNFSPGLGNQLFEYIFVEYLKKTYPQGSVYGYYHPKFLDVKHNGLEFHRVFDVELPAASTWSDYIAFLCRSIARLIPIVKATEKRYSEKAIYYDGWWQDKCYFLDTVGQIRFRQTDLDDVNSKYVNDMSLTESVSLHVRRGDYLDPVNAKQYGDICTLDYYKKAISVVRGKLSNPHFYVFSNDIDWCKKNLHIEGAVYVTNNTGKNSWLDMYLMSRCKANILANSSFSYWGAMLNINKPQLVVYPKKWFNTHTPDIFMDNWLAID